ncbi:MAG: DUF262 domain-containing protein [Cyclobacteriaceae bacterium]|nr:DUF262 domain-containing protein [Cyclobacteriaceae bacterium]
MDAKSKSLSFLSNEGLVTIPFFQRSYVWAEDNWEDLLADLLNFKKSHFLGSLILKQQPPRSGEPKEVHVIDGQQRLTTLSVLVKALYDSFADDLKRNCEISVRSNLFHKQYQTDSEYFVKIQHSHVDAAFFQQVIRFGIDDVNITEEELTDNRIIKCYWFFRRKLSDIEESIRKRLFNSILDQENKMLVVIDLTRDDDEQSIFDTINSAGVRLSSADIIKNSLFQKLLEIQKDQSKAAAIYRRTWEKSFLNDEETISYWERERITGRLKRDNIELLLHAIAVIKGFYDPDKHTLSDLSQLYKEMIDEFSDVKSLTEFIEEICEYSSIYKDKILEFESTTLFDFKNYNQRLFHILEASQISTFHPFILFLHKKYGNNEIKVTKLLFDLERYLVRRIIGKAETKGYNKICRDFIDDPESIEPKLEKDSIVIEGLKGITNKSAAIILFWVELARRAKEKKFDTKELKYSYSLEHLMPQKWEEYWTDIPSKKTPDGLEMNDDQAKADRYEKIYWIGNMTLLTSSLNTSLRNYSYEIKMNGEGRKKGIKAYSDLSITKHDLVELFDSGDKTWDEEKIIARTNALFTEIDSIWGITASVIK